MLEENALVESGIGRVGLVAMSVIGAIILGVIAIAAWYNFGHSDAFSENAKIALYLLDRGDDPTIYMAKAKAAVTTRPDREAFDVLHKYEFAQNSLSGTDRLRWVSSCSAEAAQLIEQHDASKKGQCAAAIREWTDQVTRESKESQEERSSAVERITTGH